MIVFLIQKFWNMDLKNLVLKNLDLLNHAPPDISYITVFLPEKAKPISSNLLDVQTFQIQNVKGSIGWWYK